MNKILLAVLIIIGFALIGYNVTLVDPGAPFEGDSLIALIGIMAALCAIVLLLVYQTSRKIKNKIDED